MDTDSRPGSPPPVQKPRISFSISALLGGENKSHSNKTDRLKHCSITNNKSGGYTAEHLNESVSNSRYNSSYEEDDRSTLHSPPLSEDDLNSETRSGEVAGVDDRDSDDDLYDEYHDYGKNSNSINSLRAGMLPPSYLAAHLGPNFSNLASSLQASGLPLNFGPHSVLRVPAQRPNPGYPHQLGLGAPPPWLPHGLSLPPLDRATALAPHFPTLDRLTGNIYYYAILSILL